MLVLVFIGNLEAQPPKYSVTASIPVPNESVGYSLGGLNNLGEIVVDAFYQNVKSFTLLLDFSNRAGFESRIQAIQKSRQEAQKIAEDLIEDAAEILGEIELKRNQNDLEISV